MTDIAAFGPNCTLGEGPLWHPTRQELFWFDIPEGNLFSATADGALNSQWSFDEPVSVAGWIDENRLMIATASALIDFDLETAESQYVCAMEPDNLITRSNDGRVGPDGSFWIGTMARDVSPNAGTYYRYHDGQLDVLMSPVSIPNATCFSPDGRTAYIADTRKQIIWSWALDEHGAPLGDKVVHIDLQSENLNPDGAVCDAEGYLWNAQWGASRIARYAPDGSLDRVIDLPVSQPTCPAFGGEDLKILFITSAKEGLSDAELAAQPMAGQVLRIELEVAGQSETRINLG